MRKRFERNLDQWNPNMSIMCNLEELFEMKLMSQSIEHDAGDKIKNELKTNKNCSICNQFASEEMSDVVDSLLKGPSVYCQNCHRAFHQSCLNRVIFQFNNHFLL